MSAKRGTEQADGSPGAGSPPAARNPIRMLLLAGISLTVLGTALAFGGTVVAPLFRPGTTAILIGLLLAAGAGAWASFRRG